MSLLSNVTTTGAGAPMVLGTKMFTAQVSGQTTSGTGAATVLVQVSNDGANWLTAGTLSLTLGTSTTTDGVVLEAPWEFVRGNVQSISGTGASVSLFVGV